MKKTHFAMVLLFVMVCTFVISSTSVLAQTGINASEIEEKYGIKGCNDANCKIIGNTLFLNGGAVNFGINLQTGKKIMITGNTNINGKEFYGEIEIDEVGKFRVKNGGIGDVKGIENAVCTESAECAIGKDGGKVEGLPFAGVEGLKKEGNKLTGTCQEGCKLPGGATFVEGSAGKEFTVTLGEGEGSINTLEVKGCDATNPCKLQMTDTTDTTPIRLKTTPGKPIEIVTADGGKLNLGSGEIIYDSAKGKWYVPASAVPNTMINGVTFIQNVPTDITLIPTNKNSPTYTSKGEMSAEFYANGVSVVNNVDNSLFTVNLNPSGKGNIFGTFIVDPADTFKLSAYNGGRVYIDGSKEIPDVNMQGHALVTNDKTQIMFENGKVYGTPYDEGGNSVASKIRFLDANNQPLNIGGEEWYVTFGNVDFEQCAKELAAVGVPGAPEADVCGVVTGLSKELVEPLKDIIPLDAYVFYAGGCFGNKEQAPQPAATSFLSFVGRAWGWVTGRSLTLTTASQICLSCMQGGLSNFGELKMTKCTNFYSSRGDKEVVCISPTDYKSLRKQYDDAKNEWDTSTGGDRPLSSKCFSQDPPDNCEAVFMEYARLTGLLKYANGIMGDGYPEGQEPPLLPGEEQTGAAAPRITVTKADDFKGSLGIENIKCNSYVENQILCDGKSSGGYYIRYSYIKNTEDETWFLTTFRHKSTLIGIFQFGDKIGNDAVNCGSLSSFKDQCLPK